jgi:hypothetical protein
LDHIFTNLDTLSTDLAKGRLRKIMDDMAHTSAELKKVATEHRQRRRHHGQVDEGRQPLHQPEQRQRELDLLLEDLRTNPNRYFSVFGKKDRLPKLSDADIERIGKVYEKKKPSHGHREHRLHHCCSVRPRGLFARNIMRMRAQHPAGQGGGDQ